MLNTGRVLTLSNGVEYAVVTSTGYENQIYVYVANLNDENDTKICAYENDELIEVTDEDLLVELELILVDDFVAGEA